MHDKRLKDIEKESELELFFSSLANLEDTEHCMCI